MRVDRATREHANERPDAIAIVESGNSLTYRDLADRTADLTRSLVEAGIGRGASVAVLADRSPGAIVAMLSIMECGAAFVALDPRTPGRRNAMLCSDCGARAVVAQAHLRWPALQLSCPHLLTIDWSGRVTQHPTSVGGPGPTIPGDTAYITYTSGTTGSPNGVLIPHSALANYVRAASVEYGITDRDRVLQFAPFTFDNSAEEIFIALTNGATLILRSRAMAQSSDDFWAFCRANQVSVVDLPTGYWTTISQTLRPSDRRIPTSVRIVIVGGEEAHWSAYQRWRAACPDDVRILNTYGPAETTIGITAVDVSQVDPKDGSIPIGRPMGNATCKILDSTRRPLQDGCVGEIALGGDTLATGYLNRPQLTKQRFVTIVAGDGKGERLFLTGDRGLRRTDGQIEFLGRLDAQTKVRGVRVDLREVAGALCRACQHDEATVVPVGAGGGQRLVAYIAGRRSTPTIPSIDRALRAELPGPAVPSEYRTLDELPRTTSGKVDSDQLVALASRPHLRKSEEPRTQAECRIAAVWQRAVQNGAVGRSDDFFEVGGDSLTLLSLLDRLSSDFGRRIDVADFIANPTVAGLAEQIVRPASIPEAQSIESDAVLPDDLVPSDKLTSSANGAVSVALVTGATGFVGAHLVARLLRVPGLRRVVCLVRTAATGSAKDRVLESFDRYGIEWDNQSSGKLSCYEGDVTRAQLGLNAGIYDRLAMTIDSVFHLAAKVHLTLPYVALRAANVIGTVEALRFAFAGKRKSFHYMSSLDAAELEVPAAGGNRGYAASKWVGEQLVRQAAARGLHVSVSRPGWIVGSVETGALKEGAILWCLLQEALQTGVVPDCSFLTARPVVVDDVCEALLSLTRERSTPEPVTIVGNVEVRGCDVLSILADYGWVLRPVPVREWHATLVERANDRTNLSARSILAYLADGSLQDNQAMAEPPLDGSRVLAGRSDLHASIRRMVDAAVQTLARDAAMAQ